MFILLVCSTLVHSYLCVRISSSCGHPGLPPDATIYQTDPDRIRFADGQAIRYRCPPEFHIFKQTRKCLSGRWIGPKARCGVPIENDVQSVRVFDCSDNKMNKEILNFRLNQSENPLRLTNSFHASRLESGPVVVNESSCYLWKLRLKTPTIVSFMTIDVATRLIDSDPESPLSTDLFNAEVAISPHRLCRSLHKVNFINPDPFTNETFLLSGLYFSCDSVSEEDYLIEKDNMSHTLTLKTHSAVPRDMNLVAVFLAKHKIDPKNDRPECGKPETVMTGVNHRVIYKSGISQFQIQCNDSFIDITANNTTINDKTKPDFWYSLNCSVNGQWEGVFPVCAPKVQCPGMDYLEAHKDSSVFIESIENVHYLNSSYWVASEYSQVNFGCVDPEHIVVGKLVITCMKNGEWSHHMPKCTAYVKPESLSTVAYSPWIVIAVLTICLFFFMSFVLLIVRKYVQNMRRELIRYRTKSRIQNSIYTDVKSNSFNQLYDDCDNTNIVNIRSNRLTKKAYQRCKYETEYIELEGCAPTEGSADPLYIAILPPTQ